MLWSVLTAIALAEVAPASRPPELDRAVVDFAQGCDLGSGPACAWLARLAEQRPSLGVAYPQQVSLLAQACRLDDLDACADWGLALATGPLIDRDWDRIGKLWQDSCEKGDPTSCRLLSNGYAEGVITAPDQLTEFPQQRLQAAFDALLFDVGRARGLARPYLGDHDYAEQARLILACADIAEGHWEQALSKSADRAGIDSAYGVIAQLVRERQANPDELWPKSYARAWARAGQPDLRKSLLFLGRTPLLLQVPPSDTATKLARMLVEYERWEPWLGHRREPPEDLPSGVVERALDLVDDTAEPARLLALRILQSPHLPGKLRDRAHDAVIKLTERLAQESPDDLAMACLAFFAQGSLEAFNSDELQTLERIARLPKYRAHLPATYDSYVEELWNVDPGIAQHRAAAIATSVMVPTWWQTFLRRAATTRAQDSANTARLDAIKSALEKYVDPPVDRVDRWSVTSPDLLLLWPIPDLQTEVIGWKVDDPASLSAVLDTTSYEATH